MSILKVLLLVGGAAVAVFAWMLWYVLTPTVRDVSDYAAVRGLLNRPLALRQPAFLHRADEGQY